MMTVIATIKELLQLYKGNESFIKFLIFGSDKFKEEKVGHKPGETVNVNKYKTVQLRQNEFLYRIYFLDCIVIIIQKFVYDMVGHIGITLPISMRLTFITLEMFFLLVFYDETYKSGIIELFFPNTKQLKKTETPLFGIHITMFLIYIMSVWISATYLDFAVDFIIIFMLIIFLAIFVITSISHDKTDKMTIYSFITNREYSKSDDNVDLERDILIKLRNGMDYQVNLLFSEFLFCDNDDIIVLVSKDIADVDTIKTNINKLLQSKRFRKEDVAKIVVGQAELKYDTERGWHKVGNS